MLLSGCTHATNALPLIYTCCTDYQLDFFEHTLTDAPTVIPWSSPGSCLILSPSDLMYRTCNPSSLCGCSFSININRAVIFEYALPTIIWIYLNMHKYFFSILFSIVVSKVFTNVHRHYLKATHFSTKTSIRCSINVPRILSKLFRLTGMRFYPLLTR